jgi:hypothetical protein
METDSTYSSLHSQTGSVDEELRAELFARREEDQRMRHAAATPPSRRETRAQDGCPTTWAPNGSASTPPTPSG